MSYFSPLCSSDLRSPAIANRSSMSGTRLMHTAIFKPTLPMEAPNPAGELAANLVAHRVGCQTHCMAVRGQPTSTGGLHESDAPIRPRPRDPPPVHPGSRRPAFLERYGEWR